MVYAAGGICYSQDAAGRVDRVEMRTLHDGTTRAWSRGMQYLERQQLSIVFGGDDISAGPVRDENTGACGLGPYSFGKTEECKAHDDCVGKWDQVIGRPGADVMCLPKLPAAVASAVRCAADPFCPK